MYFLIPFKYCIFSKNKNELKTILNMIDLKFDVIGITATKLISANPPIGILI